MNAVLWILQIVLAVFCFTGGAYKVFMFHEVASEAWYGALPRLVWGALGVFEIVCGLVLVVPALTRGRRELVAIAAAALMVETVALAAIYGSYSLQMRAENPLVWVLMTALLAALVAYGRYAGRR